MNAITDLTARAVSFITAIQTTLLNGSINAEKADAKYSVINIEREWFKPKLLAFIEDEKIKAATHADTTATVDGDGFYWRAIELVWVSRKTRRDADDALAVAYAIELAEAVFVWIRNNEKNGLFNLLPPHELFPTPYGWREAISAILYNHPEERVLLAEALQYLPIQIVLALGAGNFTAPRQRILQMWRVSNSGHKLLEADERRLLFLFDERQAAAGLSAATLLRNKKDELFQTLISDKIAAPLSFEDIFKKELTEIQRNRQRREAEHFMFGSGDKAAESATEKTTSCNPFVRGKEMALYALAFSGGGIRSATFNLGILQGLAKSNLITRFDYLSTVSGGGYIGSWLAAWIKRDGSVVKITNRLRPDKSPDPLGEELKPIKWLRMFSNYFAPDASIMSADSWTIGMTWLRNTLLNQIIILLLLLSLLFTGRLLYVLWNINHTIQVSQHQIWLWSAILIIPVAVLSGLGMHVYLPKPFQWQWLKNTKAQRLKKFRLWFEEKQWWLLKKENTEAVSLLIIAIAVFGALLLSAWTSTVWRVNNRETDRAFAKMKVLWPAAVVTFTALCIVAGFGRYDISITRTKKSYPYALFTLVLTAAIATFVGVLCIVAMWTLLGYLEPASSVESHNNKVQFIFGVPLALEVFSITVVTRMALLGKYFPDERREWWGRMGGYVHRISFLWILIAASALLGQAFIGGLFKNWWAGYAAGGWIALVGSTVKAAFSANTSGKEGGAGPLSKFLKLLGLAGPYLFALGLLIFLPGLLQPILTLTDKVFNDLHLLKPNEDVRLFFWPVSLPNRYAPLRSLFLKGDAIKIFSIIVVFGLTAYYLARKVGVNEFSMHHFYRNRLVRAYLGATRRSTDRQRTSNPFTGFDIRDDEQLSKMTNEAGYYGPYPVLNAALNASQLTDLDRQDRKAESFIFSPLYCGFDFSMIRASADAKTKSYDYAYRQTKDYAYPNGGPGIGTAMAVSGAAVNPNQGYHSAAATAFLLTVFNVQMGRWIGNPRKSSWGRSDPRFGLGYIINNLIGKTNTRNNFIALSDGGHFDNMGLYEMIRRRCQYIVLCDAEQDGAFTCEGFANAIRRCRIDFGAEIKIDITKIVSRPGGTISEANYAIGTITYAGEKEPGKLLYIKSSIRDDTELPVDIREYALKNKTFPHQTTADQFFDEEQFESYRRLGMHIANHALDDKAVKEAFNF